MSLIDDSRNRPLFPRGPGVSLRAAILMALCVLLMVRDTRGDELLRLRQALHWLAAPLIWFAEGPVQLSGLGHYLDSKHALRDRNQQLEAMHERDAARLLRLESLNVENRRLRELLLASDPLEHQVQAAEIVRISQDPYRQQLLIDKGSRDGVSQGQALIDSLGVVGQVVETYPTTALVLQITDAEHGLPVENARTGEQSIAQGVGDGRRLQLPFLPGNEDILVGDLLLSSALGGRFPPGYPVARVSEVRYRDGEPFKEAIAVPTAQLRKNRPLLLVKVGEAPVPDAAEVVP